MLKKITKIIYFGVSPMLSGSLCWSGRSTSENVFNFSSLLDLFLNDQGHLFLLALEFELPSL